jgi:hypothetical protein
MTRAGSKPSSIDRPLGSTENLYWLLDQLYCLNFVVFAEVEGRLDAHRVAAALASVQAENPLLRARIATGPARRWFKAVPQASAPMLPEVLRLAHWRREVERQLDARFDTARAPLARLLWFKGAGRRSVVAMTYHHAIADGRSGAKLLLDVLRRAAGEAPPTVLRPAQPSSQSLDLIRRQTPLLGALKQTKFWLERGKDALQPAQQLPGYDPSPATLRRVRVLAYELDASTLTALHGQAHEHRTTVHGALGAAQLLAINEQFPDDGPRRLALNSLADLRASLSGGLTDADLGLYIATLCTVHAMPRRPQFWPLAREIRDALAAIIDAGEGNLIHGVYPAGLALPAGGNFARWMQAIVAAAPASSMLTNIGRIDHVDLGDSLRLKSVAFVVPPPAQHPVCVTAASYDGRMSVQLLYDALKLSGARAGRIGDTLMGHLREAAGHAH